MTWTYGGELGTSPRDMVRWHLGDRVQTAWSPTDGEVDYWLDLNTDDSTGIPDTYAAAAEVAQAMANRFSTLTTSDVKIGGMSLKYSYSEMATKYYDLADRLRAGRTDLTPGGPQWGDDVENSFSIGLMDHP